MIVYENGKWGLLDYDINVIIPIAYETKLFHF